MLGEPLLNAPLLGAPIRGANNVNEDLRVRLGDCGSVKTASRDNLAWLTSRLGALKTMLEDNQVEMLDCKVSSKVAFEDSRTVAFEGFLHFQVWKSMLSAAHPAEAQIGTKKFS